MGGLSGHLKHSNFTEEEFIIKPIFTLQWNSGLYTTFVSAITEHLTAPQQLLHISFTGA